MPDPNDDTIRAWDVVRHKAGHQRMVVVALGADKSAECEWVDHVNEVQTGTFDVRALLKVPEKEVVRPDYQSDSDIPF